MTYVACAKARQMLGALDDRMTPILALRYCAIRVCSIALW